MLLVIPGGMAIDVLMPPEQSTNRKGHRVDRQTSLHEGSAYRKANLRASMELTWHARINSS